ncbi:beta-hexosaminidase subunit beta-like [Pectinophora gossypiella]|uniref:beta-hexosaminidase subunit beta-like n=1 Tax=Pectinophora gossypiella TaxID=13191 RepID=UPI00214F11CA|nr:beta-hexosaminidase subunit beta-like [Pectinophora gossypiella]
MSRVIILCALAAVTVALGPLPSMPTRGSIWPKPYSEQKGNVVYVMGAGFDLEMIGCAFMGEIQLDSISKNMFNLLELAYKVKKNQQDIDELPKSSNLPVMNYLTTILMQPNDCDTYPHADMDESYNLTVKRRAVLKANTVWGIIRGLESFSQLFYMSDDYKEVRINATTIYDYPQYSHRGIMVDTSRHYLSMDTMHKLLDGMATNKMNVLHWHIADDPSFPYKSKKFPELSEKGHYYPSMTYNRSEIWEIVKHARRGGIRVILEMDTPGHVTSWGLSHPEIMTQCKEIGPRPLNPVKNETYELLRGLFREVQDILPERYLHLGGDEVFKDCWTEDPITQQYMKEHNMSTDDLYGLYMNNTMKLLKEYTVPVMWEEAFFNKKTNMTHAVVQAWRPNSNIAEIIKTHTKVIFSSEWHLDNDLTKRFDDFYKIDPRQIAYNATGDHSLDKYIIGGEACMWGEMVDDNNILSRIFPRASGVAEALWSGTNGTVPDEAFNRMEEQACRMLRHGYPAAPPSGPGFCITIKNVIKP